MRMPSWLSQHLAALRMLLVFTVLLGLAYPVLVFGLAHLPGLSAKAEGSTVSQGGRKVGSRIIGQGFTGKDGKPLVQYFQSRPSAAGDGYDPTSTSASNLGPEDIVGTKSLLSQVCARSKAVGELEGVDGGRPFCTPSGVGAVLGVFRRHGDTGEITRVVSLNEQCPAVPFLDSYQGVAVECARKGQDYSHGLVVPVRGDAPARPKVPADAVTASGSGLDPDISVAYARLQAPRVARERGVSTATVLALVRKHTRERALGFIGDPSVNVLGLNLDLDRTHPYQG